MRLAALAVSIVIAASLLWIGAEQHYQSCVMAAQAWTATDANSPWHGLAADAGVKSCSRSPF